jgi:hypothetical protein
VDVEIEGFGVGVKVVEFGEGGVVVDDKGLGDGKKVEVVEIDGLGDGRDELFETFGAGVGMFVSIGDVVGNFVVVEIGDSDGGIVSLRPIIIEGCGEGNIDVGPDVEFPSIGLGDGVNSLLGLKLCNVVDGFGDGDIVVINVKLGLGEGWDVVINVGSADIGCGDGILLTKDVAMVGLDEVDGLGVGKFDVETLELIVGAGLGTIGEGEKFETVTVGFELDDGLGDGKIVPIVDEMDGFGVGG